MHAEARRTAWTWVDSQREREDADARGAAVRTAADRLWAAHAQSIIALTADPLLIIYVEDAVRSAARGLWRLGPRLVAPVIGSGGAALLLAPARPTTNQQSRRLLVGGVAAVIYY